MADAVLVRTPCKVNLHLGVHRGRDERGYHRVDSVMAPVALYDDVTVRESPELEVAFSPELGIAPERSGVWRAAALLAQALGREPRVRIDVVARIPERAGLGGSSADAGAALRALAELWGVDPLDGRVISVAWQIGADVAFFLDPRTALFGGAGDVLERALPCSELPVALVMPRAEGGSTPEAYAEFDRSGEDPASPEALVRALEAGDVAALAGCLHNNLAPAACALCPEVGAVEAWLRGRPGVWAAQVTGSGTCSFALCESADAADCVVRAARERGWRAWSTKILGSSEEVC